MPLVVPSFCYLTFLSSGSLTVSERLFKAFRIWLAATEVEVFSKALLEIISCAVSHVFERAHDDSGREIQSVSERAGEERPEDMLLR